MVYGLGRVKFYKIALKWYAVFTLNLYTHPYLHTFTQIPHVPMVNIEYTYILLHTQTLGYQEVFFGREINDNHDYRHIPKTNA